MLPTVEVSFQNINVSSKIAVGSRALPTLPNSVRNFIEVMLALISHTCKVAVGAVVNTVTVDNIIVVATSSKIAAGVELCLLCLTVLGTSSRQSLLACHTSGNLLGTAHFSCCLACCMQISNKPAKQSMAFCNLFWMCHLLHQHELYDCPSSQSQQLCLTNQHQDFC